MLRIALVGDYNESVVAHRAIPLGLERAARDCGCALAPSWVATEAVLAGDPLAGCAAIWCVPGSPYRSADGALAAIRRAREQGLPFLGTCGGFQHALIEYARHVCGIAGAEHGESAPQSELAIVTPLACPLIGEVASVRLAQGSHLHAAYGSEQSDEEYQCSFGLDRRFRERLEDGNLSFTAFDAAGDVRGAELRAHPFFVATLFQPERAALKGSSTPPLVRAFVRAAMQHAR